MDDRRETMLIPLSFRRALVSLSLISLFLVCVWEGENAILLARTQGERAQSRTDPPLPFRKETESRSDLIFLSLL